MTYPPTAAEFLASTDPDEDDTSDLVLDPLESIADSLRRFLDMAQTGADEEKESDRLREAYDDLDAKAGVLLELVEEIEATVKPSTSKLANAVREVIDRWRGVEPEPGEQIGPEQVEPVREPSPPANDAPLEQWLDYAEAQGLEVDRGRTNRSQIRTMLGLPHFDGGAQA